MSELTRRVKPYYESFTSPLLELLRKKGVSPHAVTVTGFILTAAGSAFLYLEKDLLAFFLLLAGALADGIDGALARRTGRSSRFGAFLDSTLDRLSDALPFVALTGRFAALADETGALLSSLALTFSLAVSYARARAESLGVKGVRGFMERTERWAVLLTGLLLGLLKPALVLILLGSMFTLLQRILETKKALEGEP
ncbi:MAG: CDP-alcohol phosphatidyltransferase family protein [Aquificae bacterium]|nr:CDP-alcohol phosphatidyltransferase family protein [Aquificota bacterium]